MVELAVALVLIALNGLFSLSELAIVSARRVRLKVYADAGRVGARTALALSEDPGRFLSTVQIGITLIGILAGAFSGAALGARATGWIIDVWQAPRAIAEPLGYGLVIGLITYLSVVVGELVPKNLALRNAESIACTVAPLMSLLSRIAAPVVWLLDASTKLVFRLLGAPSGSASAITEEEIRTVVAEAETAGVIERDEGKMISGVLRLGDRAVRAIMTPRTEVEWIDLDDAPADILERLRAATHARLPVGEGGPDNMIGVVQIRDLVPLLLAGGAVDAATLRQVLREVPVLPDGIDALDALDRLQSAPTPIALVHDEYGHFEGVVTPADILDAIAGAFVADAGSSEPEIVQRGDGSYLVAGWMPVDELADQLGLTLPVRRPYETVAGLVIGQLHHLPQTGEVVETLGWRFEVVDMDGRRIDKILVSRSSEK